MRNTLSILLLISFSTLISCVEVKDNNDLATPKTPQAPEVQIQNVDVTFLPDLIVDQPLFLYKGEVLTATQFQQIAEGSNTHEDQLKFDFNKLEFKPGGILYTMGASVVVNAKVLLSDRGSIETFPS